MPKNLCDGGSLLCLKNNCDFCFNNSFASFEKSKYYNLKLNNNIQPRYIRKGTHKKYWFDCNNCPHSFLKTIFHITRPHEKSWCPYCSVGNPKLCEDENCKYCFNRSLASHWKGEFVHDNISPRTLSITSNRKINFICNDCDEPFNAKISNVISRDSWCPLCKRGKNEKKCCEIIERLIGEKFPTKRPRFIKGLEYDGYCEKLKLAFEYQGIQHYEYISKFFHKRGYHTFISQLLRDEIKKRISKQQNIALIIIPYNVKNKEQFIKTKLEIFQNLI